MAPSTTDPAAQDATTRRGLLELKRLIFALTNFITLIITCFYISWAYRHNDTINAHPTELKTPYGGMFDLSYEKVGYSFAIGRAVFAFLCLLPILAVPEWLLFLFALLNLVFEIPLAAVANSTFGYGVVFSTLDLTPSTVYCYDTTMSAQQWGFYAAYARVVGTSTYNVCREFVHEGAVLRGSLMFSWFTIWLSFFLLALTGAACKSERKWSDLLTYFTGIEFSWSGVWACVRGLKPKVRVPRLRRRGSKAGSASDVSTLVDEVVVVDKGANEKTGV